MAGKTKASEEQLLYAKVLETGMRIGLLGIVITGALYIFGVLPATVPVDEISKYWGLPVDKYLEATGLHPGWGWINHLGSGDLLNFVPIAILAGITIVCYIAIIPTFLRKGDKIYAVIAVLEVLVLMVAASGVVGGGGH